MRVCMCAFNNVSVCFVQLYCPCVPYVICQCLTVLCQYLFILFILCVNAPWLEVHFSNRRSNLNLCINSFLGFERLYYGCEIRELCLIVFLLFVLVTCTHCICVVIDILVL